MEVVAQFFKVSIPVYLKRLPIPESVDGITKLSGDDWVKLLPFFGLVLFLVYCVVRTLIPRKSPKGLVNFSIEKEREKVATPLDMEDLGDRTCFCRCWKSKKFPYCDGAHNRHNKETGDNVGPVVIKRRNPEK